jgi:hypothetical protein
MRYYFLRPLRKSQTEVPLAISSNPASLTLDRVSPGNVASVTVSLNRESPTAVAVTVSSSDVSVTVSPGTFSLGGANPVSQVVTLTGTSTGPDAVNVQITAAGLADRTISVNRPVVPLNLTVAPASLTLGRVSPGNMATVTAVLNRVPETAVLVSVNSSDASVAVDPASFSLSTGNPPSRDITLTGSLTGPNAVTVTINPVGLSTRSVSVTRPAFSPDMIAGLALWLDAADASTITVDNTTNVSEWREKSSNGRHLSQSTPSSRPAYNLAQYNGRASVNHDPNESMTSTLTSAESFFGPGRNTITIFEAFRYASGGPITSRIFDGTDSNRVDRQSSFANTLTWSGTGYSTNNASASTSFRVMVRRFDGNAGTYLQRVDGTLVQSAANFTGYAMGSSNNYRVRLGNEVVGSAADFGEFLVFNRALTDTELGLIENYLRAKWTGV